MIHLLPCRMRQALVFVVMAIMVGMSGCGARLSSRQTIELVPNDIRTILVEAVSREQTIQVTGTSDGAPIRMHIYLVEDEDAVDRAITLEQPSDKVIASGDGSQEISLEAVIPAGKEAAVRLQTEGAESATVTLTIAN